MAELFETEIVVTFTTDWKKVVIAEAMLEGDRTYISTASASVDPGDQFDFDTGVNLAVGRAVRQLGRDILNQGQKTVHKKDKARRIQKQKSAEINAAKDVQVGRFIDTTAKEVPLLTKEVIYAWHAADDGGKNDEPANECFICKDLVNQTDAFPELVRQIRDWAVARGLL